MGHSDAGAWGAGDTISAAGGVIYLILGWYLLPARRTFEGLAVFLATGVSLAPSILILIDPSVQFVYAHVLGVKHPLIFRNSLNGSQNYIAVGVFHGSRISGEGLI